MIHISDLSLIGENKHVLEEKPAKCHNIKLASFVPQIPTRAAKDPHDGRKPSLLQ